MKKSIIILYVLFFIFINFKEVKSEELLNDGISSILIEVNTKKVIYANNEHRRLYPASMTKIMTLLLTMEAIENKLIDYDTMVKTSKYASSIKGSTILLAENEEMSVNDLLKGVAIQSGNDAATSLAEKIGGNVDLFVEKMNDKIKELGLINTEFKNPTGLTIKGHYSSSYDMALIARELLYKYPEILNYSKIYDDYLRTDTNNPFWLVNTNKLVKTYPGVDGLKTGWTKEAGYCLTATINKNNMRLIGVIMGAKSSETRNEEMIKLLEYGFTNYELNTLKEKNTKYKTLDSILYKEPLSLILETDISVLKKKLEDEKEIKIIEEIDYKKIKSGETKNIGKIYLYYDHKLYNEINLNLEKKVQKNNIFNILLEILLEIY